MQDLQFHFGYDKLFTVEPSGRSGGLALFYMNSSSVQILFSNDRMIDIETSIEGHKVYMTFVYGDPVIACRENVWDSLITTSQTRDGVWFMIGDFNEITGNHEKRGGRRRAESTFLPFRSMLAHCGMIEFPYTGNSLSWVGRRSNGKVQCRLDRAVGNEDWHTLFSHTKVEYLKLWGSDHRPVLARIQTRDRRIQKSFKFDKRCLGKMGFKEAVEEGWGEVLQEGPTDIYAKVAACRKAISSWKRNNPLNAEKKIEDLKIKLDAAQGHDLTSPEDEMALKGQLCAALRDNEIFWKQKSRATWLREGDRNTKFFHATTKQRRA